MQKGTESKQAQWLVVMVVHTLSIPNLYFIYSHKCPKTATQKNCGYITDLRMVIDFVSKCVILHQKLMKFSLF